MASDHRRRTSTTEAGVPIPTPSISEQRYSDVARNVFDKLRYGSKKSSTQRSRDEDMAAAVRIGPVSSQTTSFDTGLKIRALDINQERSHVVLAGGRILKTVQVGNSDSAVCTEDFDIRTAVVNYSANDQQRMNSQLGEDIQVATDDIASAQKEPFDVEDVAWSNGIYKNYIATAASNGKIMLYSMERPGVRIARLHEHYRQVHKVDFNPMEGAFLLSGSQDGTVRLWDMRNPRRDVMLSQSKDTFPGRSDGVRHVKWSPRHTFTFAFATDSGTIQRWDTRNNSAPVLKISGHYETCQSIDWHRDGKHLVSAGKDQNVRVWNMAPESRRQKPAFSFRAPREIQNVRWRLPCLGTDLDENVVKQCTQLATSYRRSPVIHVWDLRRPLLPFKEIHHTKNTGTTDMLWRTTDHLWSVGPDGVFTQTDVPFTPKTMDRRSLSSFAASPSSDLVFYTEQRPYARNIQIEIQSRKIAPEQRQSDSPEKPLYGRSPGDEGFDEQFVTSSSSRRHSRRSSTKSMKSVSGTPPTGEDFGKVNTRDLDHTMRVYDDFKPHQISKHGYLPGCETSPVFNYLAQKYKLGVFTVAPTVELLSSLQSIFDQNARYVELASRYRDAQTWKILGRQVAQELRRRAELNRRARISRMRNAARAKENEKEDMVKPRKVKDDQRSSLTSEFSRSVAADIKVGESSSAAPTPMAKPVTSTNKGTGQFALENIADDGIQLPPSLLSRDLKPQQESKPSIEPKTTTDLASINQSTAWEESSSKIDEQRALLNQWRAPPKTTLNLEPPVPRSDNINVPPRFDRQHSSDSLMLFSASSGSQKVVSVTDSFPSDVSRAGRGDSQLQDGKSNASSFQDEDSYRLGLSPRGTLFSRQDSEESNQSTQQQRITNTELNRLQEMQKINGQKISSDSLDSQKSLVDVFSNVQNFEDHDDKSSVLQNGVPSPTKSAKSNSKVRASVGSIKVQNYSRDDTPQKDSRQTIQDLYNRITNTQTPDGKDTRDTVSDADLDSEGFILSDFLRELPADDETSGFLNAIDMLRELLNWYTAHSDAQMASHLFLTSASILTTKETPNNTNDQTQISTLNSGFLECMINTAALSPDDASSILATTHRALHDCGLSPAWIESILTTYHEHLLALNLLNPAALLRCLAYPAFPAVYEQSLKDTQLHLLCLACNSPLNNPAKTPCETCAQPQSPCAICHCRTSPFTLPVPASKSKPKKPPTPVASAGTTPAASSLWTACLLCNHATHAACAAAWFADCSAGGACPVEGCLCDCAPGDYRRARLAARVEAAERQRRRAGVRRDDWAVGESRAVGRVRGALRGAAAAAAAAAEGERGGEEAKRVRVVEPGGE